MSLNQVTCLKYTTWILPVADTGGKNKVQRQYQWSYYYLLPLFDTCCITCFVGSVYQPALLLELTVVTDQLGFVKSMHGLNNWRWQLSLGLRCTQVPGWVITGLTPFYCRCHSLLMHLLWLTSVITILYQTYFLMAVFTYITSPEILLNFLRGKAQFSSFLFITALVFTPSESLLEAQF